MAETQEPTITAPATIAAPATVTDNPSASATPAVSSEASASPSLIVTDVKPAEIVVETKTEVKTDAKVETPAPPVTESILGDEKPKEEIKAEIKADAKPETKADTTKVEVPTYEAFKLPENISLDKEPLDAFSKILGEIETGKLDHAGMQNAGQKLIDLAAKSTTDSINRLNDYYVGIHENQKKEWFENFKKDPDMGGEKLNETVGMLRESVNAYAGTDDQVKEFRQLMKETGVGNHPALTRILYNMQKKIDSYTKETSNRAVPAQAPAPTKLKPYQTFYIGNNG